jgi:sugar (pentulose or hexulose) kinase
MAERVDVVVGVDVGTTRVKAVAFGLDGSELAVAARPTPWVTRGVTVEVDAEVLADTAATVVAEATAAVDDPEARRVDVHGIGVTGMAESGVLLDRTGAPCSPIVAWHDPRGEVDIVQAALGTSFNEVTGLPYSTVPSIMKMRELIAASDGRAVRWLNVGEWIVRRLGGDEVTEESLAGRTGLQDLHTGRWWSDALAFLGVDDSFLPGPAQLATVPCGRSSVPGCERAVLAVAGHDHQTAAFGLGTTAPGALFDSLGTAEALVRFVAPPVDRAAVLELTGVNASVGRTVVDGRLVVLAGFRTGQSLERVSRLLGLQDRAARKAMAADAAARAAHPTLRVDTVDGALAITGIADDVVPADVWHAAVDHADTEAAAMLERFDRLFGPTCDVVLAGGWVHDPMVIRTKGRRFGSARVAALSEAGALGAASIAGLAAGVLTQPLPVRTTHLGEVL